MTSLQHLKARASERVDIASLVVFRVLLGGLVSWSAARFLLNGWVERFFITPTYFFKYQGFHWLEVPAPPILYAMFIALTVCGVMIAVGFHYHLAAILALVLFTTIELFDVTNYLNHYYLVSLLLLLCCGMPLAGAASVDAKRGCVEGNGRIPRWMLWLLRFQIAAVYFWAGMAKFGADWLLHAEPMHLWMRARVDTPIIGPLLAHWEVALLMSWAGFFFDTTIWAFLLHPKTRPFAFIAVLVFHASTGFLFPIGLFPVIMVCGATLFFSPDWPREWAARFGIENHSVARAPQPSQDSWPRPLIRAAIVFYCVAQVLIPARHLLYRPYGGDVLWDEQGMRWAWKVMVREKNGSITYLVRLPGKSRDTHVSPTRYLTDHQAREMSGQPDLILQLAHHIGEDYRARGHDSVQVRVDAVISLNGRPPARFIDPDVDLLRIHDGLGRSTWVLPPPSSKRELTTWTPQRLAR